MKKLLLLLAILFCIKTFSQEEKQQDSIASQSIEDIYKNVPNLKLFLDCDYCDMNYIQQMMDTWRKLEFVRDQSYADVHIMVRTRITGNGGKEHELEYQGKGFYEKVLNKHAFSTSPNNSFAENREVMMDNILMGLSLFNFKHFNRYEHLMIIPGQENKDSINETKPSIVNAEEQKDKWNSWVFNIGVNGSLSGQESSESSSFGGNFSAKRVTKKNKFMFRASYNNDKSEYDYGEFKVSSDNKNIKVNIYDAYSISNHWSLGMFLDGGRSTYANHKLFYKFKPAIEYSFFDYKDSASKQITFSYRVGGVNYEYDETTIYNKDEEFLWEHTAEISGSVRQKWGSINSSIMYESYLSDSALHAFNFHLGTNFRITSGLSFNISGNYAITKNQINLAGGDLSIEELLLRQKQVNSGYNFHTRVGLNYQFGSMFSSVVNPRFDF